MHDRIAAPDSDVHPIRRHDEAASDAVSEPDLPTPITYTDECRQTVASPYKPANSIDVAEHELFGTPSDKEADSNDAFGLEEHLQMAERAVFHHNKPLELHQANLAPTGWLPKIRDRDNAWKQTRMTKFFPTVFTDGTVSVPNEANWRDGTESNWRVFPNEFSAQKAWAAQDDIILDSPPQDHPGLSNMTVPIEVHRDDDGHALKKMKVMDVEEGVGGVEPPVKKAKCRQENDSEDLKTPVKPTVIDRISLVKQSSVKQSDQGDLKTPVTGVNPGPFPLRSIQGKPAPFPSRKTSGKMAQFQHGVEDNKNSKTVGGQPEGLHGKGSVGGVAKPGSIPMNPWAKASGSVQVDKLMVGVPITPGGVSTVGPAVRGTNGGTKIPMVGPTPKVSDGGTAAAPSTISSSTAPKATSEDTYQLYRRRLSIGGIASAPSTIGSSTTPEVKTSKISIGGTAAAPSTMDWSAARNVLKDKRPPVATIENVTGIPGRLPGPDSSAEGMLMAYLLASEADLKSEAKLVKARSTSALQENIPPSSPITRTVRSSSDAAAASDDSPLFFL